MDPARVLDAGPTPADHGWVRLQARFAAVLAGLAVVGAIVYLDSSTDRPTPSRVDALIEDTDAPRTAVDPGTLLDAVIAADPDTYRRLRAVRVVVDGQVVVQRYYGGSTSKTTWDADSVGKTVVGTLIGIALAEGKIAGLDATLDTLLPQYRRWMSPIQAKITLGQLLTMTAGLPSDRVFEGRVLDGSRVDWVRAALELPPARGPGEGFVYSGAGSHLLSAILQRATGRSTLEYAEEKLFTPMGIGAGTWTTPAVSDPDVKQAYARGRYVWPTDPQGRTVGGGGLKVTAPDLTALGQLWLAKGRWEGRQLVPAAYLAQAQRRAVGTGEDSSAGYGFQQWTTTTDDHAAFSAQGRGGQIVEVVPALKAVVVVQSEIQPWEHEVPGAAGVSTYLSLIDQVIVPALR